MAACDECRKELAELLPVWQTLPQTADEVEPPVDLKDQVMGAIFGAPEGTEKRRTAKSGRFRRTVLGGTIAAALLAGIAIGVRWEQADLPTSVAEPSPSVDVPSQIVSRLPMKAADPNMTPAAAGEVVLTKRGSLYELFIHARGLPLNRDDSAYQVWLFKDGQRQNGGTFRVDGQGVGALLVPAGENPPGFDSIGITLEPDANGTVPRGKKVLGT